MKKVAVIGLGNISTRHRKNVKQLYPNAKVIAVSSSGKLPQQLISDADKVCLDIEDAIAAKPDMAIVASPATMHSKHATTLIKAGIPILIEKPLTASVTDAQNIIETAKQHNVAVSVGYCLRYMPVIQALKDIIHTGSMGKIYNVYCETGQYLPDWRPTKNYRYSVSASKSLGGGALLELSHEVDYLHYIFGDLKPVAAILRSSEELELEVEDLADVLALTSDNSVVNIHLDFLQKTPRRIIRIITENGSIDCDLIDNSLKITKRDKDYVVYEDKNFDRNQMYLDMLMDFNHLVAGKDHATISLVEAAKTVAFVTRVKNMVGGKYV